MKRLIRILVAWLALTLPVSLAPHQASYPILPNTLTGPLSIKLRPPIDPSKPMIALTFDDGPTKQTERILNVLERCGGRATFCVVGEFAKIRKSTVLRAYNLGCDIIGHSWNHRNLTKLSEDEIRKQILDTAAVIKEAMGAEPLKMYRPPYGAINDKVMNVSRDLGYAIINWSLDPLDWKTKNADTTYAYIINRVNDKAIILSHDLYAATADAMERVIPALVAKGYQLVTISELMYYSGIELEAGQVYRNGRV